MSIDANKALVRRFIERVWNAGDLHLADALVHDDYAITGTEHGPEAVKRNVVGYRIGFPDLAWSIEHMVAEDDWVAVHLLLRGTHLGPYAGVEPTGRQVEMKEMVFWRIVDGRLHTIRSVGDAMRLRIQIGALPESAWTAPVS